jgi:IS30 family transposase
MSYQQLTEGRRYQISVLLDLLDLLDQGISIALIAKAINCHRATVYRELKRCHVLQGYCPDSAQANACKMRRHSAKYTIPDTRINVKAASYIATYGKVISAIAEVKKRKRQRLKMAHLSTLDLPSLIPVSVSVIGKSIPY